MLLRSAFTQFPTLVAAVALVAASRHHPTPVLPPADLAAAMSSAVVWERYRALLKEQGKRPRTIPGYRTTLWGFWAFLAKRGKTWDKATKADARAFLDQPARAGRRRGRPLSDRTRHGYGAVLRGFYTTCAQQGWLPSDRLLGFVVPKAGRPRARGIPLGDLRRALLAAERGAPEVGVMADPRMYLMLWLGYGEGLRAAEIAALRVEDIDLGWPAEVRPARRYLRRRRRGRERIIDPGMPGSILVADGKGGRSRMLPLYPEVRAALLRWIDEAGLAATGPLFPGRFPGRPIGHAYVSRLISRFLHDLGIDESAHALRHAWAQALLQEAGEDSLLTIARMGGWSSTIQLEQVYGLGYQGRAAWVLAQLPNPKDDDPRRNGGQ
jgi:integrase